MCLTQNPQAESMRGAALNEICWADATGDEMPAHQSRSRVPDADPRAAVFGEMTRGVAHDFRNILAVIASSIRLAERHADDPEALRTCLAAARDGVDRGTRRMSRLIAFGRHDTKPRPERINALLDECALFLTYAAGPDVRVVFDLAPDLPACLVDSGRFHSALLNLVANARDAMPGGGVIEISTMRVDSRADGEAGIRLRVTDTGCGMPGGVLQMVFEPDFTTKGDSGTGLGLPQVRAFMERIGGHVSVKSAVGTGTIFDLVFPAHGPDTPVDPLRQSDRWANEGEAVPERVAPLPAGMR